MDIKLNESSGSPAGRARGSQPAKRKFFQWAVKWFYANMSENTDEKPDAPTLACLLHSIGFQLRKFEKIEDAGNVNDRELKREVVRVTIECGTSGMRACLEMDDVKCRCPNSEDASDASFWSVTGTAPAATVESTNKVVESGSNLLPSISKETKLVLNEVMHRLLGLIGDKTMDDNHNENSRSNLNLSQIGSTMDIGEMVNESVKNDSMNIVRSYTQPEITISGINSGRRYNLGLRSSIKESVSGARGPATKVWGDVKGGNIDGDHPRPSPSKITSSPVIFNELCSPLSQLSLQSEEEPSTLAENVIRAHRYLEKAVEMITGKKSPVSHNSSINDQSRFLKPRDSGLVQTGSSTRKKYTPGMNPPRRSPTNPTISRPGSSCSNTSSTVLSTSVTSNGSHGTRLTAQTRSKSPLSRRSVDSSLPKLSTTPLSSLHSLKRENSSTSTSSTTSKIPGRRKSFGNLTAPQPLKIAVAKARSNLTAAKKTPFNPSTTVSGDSRRDVDASGIPRPGSSPNSSISGNSASSGILKIPNAKGSTVGNNFAIKKSIVNPKFGYCNKKT